MSRDWLTLSQAAEQLGISTRTLRRWIHDGTLRADLGPGPYGQQYLTQGVGPLGALLGGVLGEAIGLRGTVIVAGTGTLFAFAWVLVSPVRSLGDLHPDTYFA